MKKHAVLITVLFALVVSLVSITVVFWEFYKINREQYIDRIFTKYSLITQIYREHKQLQSTDIMLEANLAVYRLYIVKDKPKKRDILKNGEVLKKEGFKSFNTSLMVNEQGFYTKNTVTNFEATMIQKDKTIYFYMQSPSKEALIRDEGLKPYNFINLLYTYTTIFAVISFAFVLVLQKLNPLIRLRKKIALYGDGDMNISFKTNSCDEIGLVSNEIEKTKNKIYTKP